MQGKQPGSASPGRLQQEGTEAALICPVALPTTEGLKLLSYASIMLSFLWSFLSASPEMGEQMRAQSHKNQSHTVGFVQNYYYNDL